MLTRSAVRAAGLSRRYGAGGLAAVCALGALAAPAAARSPHRGHGLAAKACVGAHTPIRSSRRAELQAAVVCLVNRERVSRRLPALHENNRLDRSAQGWTNVMVRYHDFTHGSDFAARISAVGFNWSMAGENIAVGYQTPSAVVRAWMASPGHCRNILTPAFLDIGTGVSSGSVAGGGGPGTWTEDFGLPMGANPPSGNTGPANGCPY